MKFFIKDFFSKCDQKLCVINSGGTTQYFKSEKGTRPEDPLSANLFIIVPEIVFLKKSKKAKQSNAYPAGNCMFKVNNRNTRTRCEICSKLTIKTPERR